MHGIEVGEPRLEWARLIDRVQAMIAPIPEGMEKLARKRGDVVRGAARFVGANAVVVGDSVLEAEHVVIATGSKPRPLPIDGAEHLITSDQVLSKREQPGEVVFIGGGVIAMEFSHVYARAGSKVTILKVLPQVLSRLDPDAVVYVARGQEVPGEHAGRSFFMAGGQRRALIGEQARCQPHVLLRTDGQQETIATPSSAVTEPGQDF